MKMAPYYFLSFLSSPESRSLPVLWMACELEPLTCFFLRSCHSVHAGGLYINTHLMLKILTFSRALFQKYISEDARGCCFDVQVMLLHGRSSSLHTYLNILSFLIEHVFPYTDSPGPGTNFMPGMLSNSEAGRH